LLYENFKARVFQPKRISNARETHPQKVSVLDELPFHRKLGFSPTTFSALCCSFLILLWFMLFQ
jgi:hypothetical protein